MMMPLHRVVGTDTGFRLRPVGVEARTTAQELVLDRLECGHQVFAPTTTQYRCCALCPPLCFIGIRELNRRWYALCAALGILTVFTPDGELRPQEAG